MHRTDWLIVGAGAAGLMAARALARAGKRVHLLEARERCGGRIFPLAAAAFGYAAEGGAEFVHGAAEVTRAVMREAGLTFVPAAGRRWRARDGQLTPGEGRDFDEAAFEQALRDLKEDLPAADFLATRFPGPQNEDLRRAVTRMVEGYDAADPQRFSTFALRDEWLDAEGDRQGRIGEGYGALIDFLAADCRRHGAEIHLRSVVAAITEEGAGLRVTCRDGAAFRCDGAIVTVPLPLLASIELPAAMRVKADQAAADIGYGKVVKILLRFENRFWATEGRAALADMAFLFTEAAVPTWWTQYPAPYPVLTGWLAGPRAEGATRDGEAIIEQALVSLAQSFAIKLPQLKSALVAARAVDWGADPFARGAYSYATPRTRAAQAALTQGEAGRLLISGEALYDGSDMGTVEAALASGLRSARSILGG